MRFFSRMRVMCERFIRRHFPRVDSWGFWAIVLVFVPFCSAYQLIVWVGRTIHNGFVWTAHTRLFQTKPLQFLIVKPIIGVHQAVLLVLWVIYTYKDGYYFGPDD